MKILYKVVGAIGVVVLATAVMAVPKALAFTGESVSLPSSAELLARGAVVNVVTTYTCNVTDTRAIVSVSLTQGANKEVASGGGGTSNLSSTCSGTSHTVTVTVFASTGGPHFVVGPAYGQAELFTCTAVACSDTRTAGVVTLHN